MNKVKTEEEWTNDDEEFLKMISNNPKFETEHIFIPNYDSKKAAFLNWRTESYDIVIQMLSISEGYIQAAKILTRSCLENNNDMKADTLIFPIVLDIVHSIEVLLKSLNIFSRDLMFFLEYNNREKIKVHGGHDILQLYNQLIPELNKLKEELTNRKESTDSLDTIIKFVKSLLPLITDIINQTKDMSAFRYPLSDKKGESQFYNTGSHKNIQIDLVVLYINIVYIEYIVNECAIIAGVSQEYYFTREE
ncbi:hypothetical protein [Carnobacterium maltaromaticum]|uniref:hypothetical protein n=1 Tax=Carnobacterium maltaromaticum TaxID=2751 RepID=UPI00107205BD|nr:hypothetical protein [Carnobacterium maltaromaticum]TFJ73083.1 hypothetical protein CKN94_10600 [Carnobacterium maltaromaticum]TFJ77946.1 hypothetical protein CKN97_09910 [Carnobacterium maltaromaticum]